MRATCPANPKHNKFITTAHIMEEWLVDAEGNWIKTRQSLQIDHGPDPDNDWTCAICGAQATVTR